MPEPTIAAGVARRLIELSESRGACRRELESRSGIASVDLEDQDNRVPFAKYAALMRAGIDLCHEPALALHFGEAADLSELSVVGLVGAASTSMMDGLAQLNRYSRLVVDADTGGADRFQIVRNAEGIWLVDARINPNAHPFMSESTFARMVSSARRRTGKSFATAVCFTHADPGYRSEYDRIFAVPIVFNSDTNALLVEDGWLDQKIPQQPRYVFGVLSERADALLKKLAEAKSVRSQVESLLMPTLHKGEARLEAVAAKMGVSRSTLSRRLKKEGATFEEVLDGLRRELALHYLSGKKVSVNEAAYLVGYSEAASFSRAFKRWTGVNPKYARKMQAGAGRE